MEGQKKVITESQLNIFSEPSRIIIAGFSNGGKSYLCAKMIEKYQQNFAKIIICGSGYKELRTNPLIKHKISFYSEIVNPLDDRDPEDTSHILVVYDDLYVESTNSKIVSDIFTKGRHENISVIFITQNIFFSGKFSRSISLNASHFILLKSRDLSQIETLGRQIFGKQDAKKFLDIYKKVISRQYGYLLVDLGVKTPESIIFRGNIVNEPPYEIVYQW